MKIMFVSAEVAPFSKVGGLADVSGNLPKYLEKEGCEVAVFTPLYGNINCDKYNVKPLENSRLKISMGNSEHIFTLWTGKMPESDINVFFVENPKYFGCFKEVYPPLIDDFYEQQRFIAFSLASMEYAKLLNFKPDIIHANDWHTAMVPVYLKSNYKYDEFYKDTKCVYTIHNLAYQGSCEAKVVDFANMRWDNVYNENCIEHWGRVNWMKGAINTCDLITTVSPRYAQEILGGEFGEGMDYTLRGHTEKLVGILNGVEQINFDINRKSELKKEITELFGLPYNPEIPLIAMVSRLVNQKGLDLIDVVSRELMKLPAQFVILGTGEKRYENMFIWLSNNSSNIRAWIDFKADLSSKIYGASDMFLMPSLFEPCGIGQLLALQYGSIPIVRAVGGLDDTIISYPNEIANGFKFLGYNGWDMLGEIKHAINVYGNKSEWQKLVQNAQKCNFSWEKSAKEYLKHYRQLSS